MKTLLLKIREVVKPIKLRVSMLSPDARPMLPLRGYTNVLFECKPRGRPPKNPYGIVLWGKLKKGTALNQITQVMEARKREINQQGHKLVVLYAKQHGGRSPPTIRLSITGHPRHDALYLDLEDLWLSKK